MSIEEEWVTRSGQRGKPSLRVEWYPEGYRLKDAVLHLYINTAYLKRGNDPKMAQKASRWEQLAAAVREDSRQLEGLGLAGAYSTDKAKTVTWSELAISWQGIADRLRSPAAQR